MADPLQDKTAAGAEGLHENPAILPLDIRAPLSLVSNPRPTFQKVLRRTIAEGAVNGLLVEPAATTGGGILHAFQELILASNRLLVDPREALPSAIRTLLWACRDLLGADEAAYVLEQAGRELSGGKSSAAPRKFSRSKDLLRPLDLRLEELHLPERMDPERFAVLQVQLDAAYDIAALGLQRFYAALGDPQLPQALGDALRSLATAVTKEIVPDQILGKGAGPGREKTGLADLLPELEREFL